MSDTISTALINAHYNTEVVQQLTVHPNVEASKFREVVVK